MQAQLQVLKKRKGVISNPGLLSRLIKSVLVSYAHKPLTSDMIEVISKEICELVDDQRLESNLLVK